MYANKRDSYPGFPNYYLAILASATAGSGLLSGFNNQSKMRQSEFQDNSVGY
jgi:hypothetical protein